MSISEVKMGRSKIVEDKLRWCIFLTLTLICILSNQTLLNVFSMERETFRVIKISSYCGISMYSTAVLLCLAPSSVLSFISTRDFVLGTFCFVCIHFCFVLFMVTGVKFMTSIKSICRLMTILC